MHSIRRQYPFHGKQHVLHTVKTKTVPLLWHWFDEIHLFVVVITLTAISILHYRLNYIIGDERITISVVLH